MIPFGPTVHVLKITLRDVKPPVWRRLVVGSDTRLPKFARMLESTMGWGGYHLHLFDVGGVLFGPDDEDFDYTIDERHATVQHLLPKVKSKLRWDYDFGDGWEHDVVVEAIDPAEEGARYPVCLDGKRACPPEDCGGPHGYANLLSVLADADHPEHAAAAAWVPDGFDPKKFDLAATNRRLRGR
jgi:Plasmid pRiA4b ORF-3-like protein